MNDIKLVKILNETNASKKAGLNEAPFNQKYMPKNINARQAFGGADGEIVASIKSLSNIAGEIDQMKGKTVDRELVSGLMGLLKTVEDKLRKLDTDNKYIR